MFKNEDDDGQQYMEQAQTEWEIDANNQKEPSKDISARVIYQYPKGQFRFPLIPDEENEMNRRESRSLKEERRVQQSPVPEKRTVDREHVSNNKRNGMDTVNKRKEPEKPKKRGPFRPTEVPSPIYGFERPEVTTNKTQQAHSAPIEYELNDNKVDVPKENLFLHKATASINDKNDKVAPTKSESTSHGSSDVSLVDVLEEAQGLNEASLEIDLNVERHAKLDESLETIITNEEWNSNFEIYNLPEKNEQNVITEDLIYQDRNLTNEIEESYTTEMESSQHIDFEDETEIEKEHEDPVIEQEKDNETEKITMVSINDERNFSNEEVLVELESRISFEEQSQNTEHDEINEEAEKSATSSSRKHIPFNVIMLNQDKQKLVQRPISSIARNENKAETVVKIEPISFADEEKNEDVVISYYEFPSKNLLAPAVKQEETSEWLYEQEQLLNSTLKNFNVGAKVVNVTQGPAVTRYEVQPEPGVKVNKITNLSDDIKLSLAARDIRIEAPIPGKHTIGIEVPNRTSRPVFISEIINSPEFLNSRSPLTAVLGLDIAGNPIVTDLRKMPHGLIAGATGSGKSVCINTILVSLLYKATPDELKLILIDPKMVELAPYNRIPHLVSPVITDVKAATAALKWAVEEMERRYELFAHTGVRDITRFNELAEEHKHYSDKLPYMVIIIDELADLMMMSPADVEEAICRIAQKARACGIHLIIATQRPSVDVITGLIKANVPTRIAFSVSSQIDSRTIIDISGAEKLLGRGDMLFLENGSSKPVRLQGTFVSDNEIDDVVAHVRRERAPEYLFEQEELLKKAQVVEDEDELFYEACEFVVEQGSASTSSLQRRFKIGYNRAARLIDMMEQQGFISETRGSKPREVHITEAELETLQDTSTMN